MVLGQECVKAKTSASDMYDNNTLETVGPCTMFRKVLNKQLDVEYYRLVKAAFSGFMLFLSTVQ